MTIESITVGGVVCDYIDQEAFKKQCAVWLAEDQLHHIVTLNPEMVVEAANNTSFAAALKKADIRTPDGSGLIWARWYLRSHYWSLLPSLIGFLRQKAQRVTGVEAVRMLVELAQEKKQTVYLLGGTPFQTKETAARLQKEFPGAKIAIAPPHTFSLDGPDTIVSDISKKRPEILLVAYGAPKQTEWIEKQREKLPGVHIAIGVGGAFAMISEDLPRAPQFLRDHNVEWLWRLALEPRRFPRIWRALVTFPALIRRQRLTA